MMQFCTRQAPSMTSIVGDALVAGKSRLVCMLSPDSEWRAMTMKYSNLTA